MSVWLEWVWLISMAEVKAGYDTAFIIQELRNIVSHLSLLLICSFAMTPRLRDLLIFMWSMTQ